MKKSIIFSVILLLFVVTLPNDFTYSREKNKHRKTTPSTTTNSGRQIIYLKDGQIFRGTIIAEDKVSITIKTKYNSKRIFRKQIKRILYGYRDLKPIYIELRNGIVINPFLVDQDNEKLIVRMRKDSPKEIFILKNNVKSISTEKIILLHPELFVRSSMFYPVDSGGSNLDRAMSIAGGVSINLPWKQGLRGFFELGHVKSKSKTVEGFSMRVIPLILGVSFRFPLDTITGWKEFYCTPRIGIGGAIVDVNNGEGAELRGYHYIATIGMGLQYDIVSKFVSAGIFLDYLVLGDSKKSMNCIAAGIGINYKL